MMKLLDFANLALGVSEEITVCEIDPILANRMGTEVRVVLLSASTLNHIMEKHDHLTTEDFMHLPDALKLGMAVHELERPLTVAISYQSPAEGKRYKAILKSTRFRDRIYLQTFHRTRPRQTRSMLQNGELIRKHW